jgi:hypothetical protein
MPTAYLETECGPMDALAEFICVHSCVIRGRLSLFNVEFIQELFAGGLARWGESLPSTGSAFALRNAGQGKPYPYVVIETGG